MDRNHKYNKLQLTYVITAIILLTSSFDIFAVFEVAGMTFRISQIFALLGFFLLLFKGKISMPIGYQSLFIWILLQAIFVVRSPNIPIAVGYLFWLILDVLLIIFFQNSFQSKSKVDRLLRLYIFSFVVIAMLGLLQWALSILGINFYLTQATFNGTRIPRLNGFTYEPSYYSTYLLPGWIIIMYLMETGSDLFTSKQLKRYVIIVS